MNDRHDESSYQQKIDVAPYILERFLIQLFFFGQKTERSITLFFDENTYRNLTPNLSLIRLLFYLISLFMRNVNL